MMTAAMIVWTIGLVGALLLTLVILKEVELVLKALAAIYHLTRFTREAARGLAGNVTAVSALAPLGASAEALRQTAARQAQTVATIARKLQAGRGG